MWDNLLLLYKLYRFMDITLKAVPDDVRKVIIREQALEKESRGVNQFSMSTTIFKIIREWNNKCKATK